MRLRKVSMCLLAAFAMAGCKGEQLTQAGYINLAGCEVPAGLTPAQAEEVACIRSDPATAAASLPVPKATLAAALITPDTEIINAAIAAHALQDGASEYAEGRHSIIGDLTGDGVPEVVALYTLEGAGGGNGSVSNLAVFVREAGQLKHVETTTVWGGAQDVRLEDGVVLVKTLVHAPDDPRCCPTLEEEVGYVFHGNRWRQVVAQPLQPPGDLLKNPGA